MLRDRVYGWFRSFDRSTHTVETSPGVWVTTGPGEQFTVSVSAHASLLPTEERDLATNFAETVKEVEAEEAKVLGRLARETEATGSPWAAAVNVFGASPPDVASVSL